MELPAAHCLFMTPWGTISASEVIVVLLFIYFYSFIFRPDLTTFPSHYYYFFAFSLLLREISLWTSKSEMWQHKGWKQGEKRERQREKEREGKG